ncbi:MAG: hypothetical protein LIO87_08775 [Eubacterium sp.]|nr:hypothetical protein [Eubacterium sp.]
MLLFCEVILLIVIYGIPFVLVFLLVSKVIFPVLKHIWESIKERQRRYNEWYNTLTPEEKIVEELKGIKRGVWMNHFDNWNK